MTTIEMLKTADKSTKEGKLLVGKAYLEAKKADLNLTIKKFAESISLHPNTVRDWIAAYTVYVTLPKAKQDSFALNQLRSIKRAELKIKKTKVFTLKKEIPKEILKEIPKKIPKETKKKQTRKKESISVTETDLKVLANLYARLRKNIAYIDDELIQKLYFTLGLLSACLKTKNAAVIQADLEDGLPEHYIEPSDLIESSEIPFINQETKEDSEFV